MSLPITGSASLVLAVIFGFAFGTLLHRGKVTDYNVIVNMFRFKDFTVLKIMLTAIIIGGVGVWLLQAPGLASYHIKSADMLAVIIGATLFGVGMVLYGYCPGTGVAAIATGSIHALVGALGMLFGGILFAFSYDWIKNEILPVASMGKIRLPELTGISDGGWFLILTFVTIMILRAIEGKSCPFACKTGE